MNKSHSWNNIPQNDEAYFDCSEDFRPDLPKNMQNFDLLADPLFYL